jgi:serpin B
VKGESDNLFFSPYSISTALAMTYNGAQGQTAKQMSHVLHFALPLERMNAAFSALSGELDNNAQSNGTQVYDLALANALWIQTGFSLNNDFLQTVTQSYGADVQQADFINNPTQADDDINSWVADQTGDEIQNLIPPSDLTPATRLVLVNAIYFQGNWASAFDPSQTSDQPFNIDAKNQTTVSMMNQEEAISYMENKQLQVAEFPYIGGNLSMVVLLPRAVDGLSALEDSLTAEKLGQLLAKLSNTEVQVYLPKFQLTSQFELSSTLSAMGMPLAFTSHADFAGISTSVPLQISHVIHKAFVDVNETGTKAAAATGVVGIVAVVGFPQTVFRVDHPFLFLIRDQTSGAILFMGRVTNPSD